MEVINADCLSRPQADLHYKKARAYLCGEENPNISIVVQAYGRVDKTRACVESILKYTNGAYDLILMDHGTPGNELTDYYQSVDYARKRIVRITKNITGVYAINSILRTLTTKYIAVVNNDIVVTTNWLENLLRCAESDFSIGMLVPTSSNISNLQSGNPGEFADYDQMQQKAAAFNQSDASKWLEKIRLIPTATLYRREVFDTVGLYDAGFMHDFGDDDFTFRVRRAGYKLILCRDTFVHHDHNQSSFPPERLAIMEHSRAFFREKYHGVDAWDDTISPMEIAFGSIRLDTPGEKRALAIDVNCGTPLLDLRGYCRLHDIPVTYSKMYTADVKYYADNQSISDCTLCGNPELLIKDETEQFDFIVLGRSINTYDEPFRFLKNLSARLKKNGSVVFCVKNVNGVKSLLDMLGVDIGIPCTPDKDISYRDFLPVISECGFTNAEVQRTQLQLAPDLRESIINLVAGMQLNCDKNALLENIMTNEYWLTIN